MEAKLWLYSNKFILLDLLLNTPHIGLLGPTQALYRIGLRSTSFCLPMYKSLGVNFTKLTQKKAEL